MESGSYTKLGCFVVKPMSFCPCGGCQSISNYGQSLAQNHFTLKGLNHQSNEHWMTDDVSDRNIWVGNSFIEKIHELD